MQDIRRQFLETSVQTLKHLKTVLQTEDEISSQFVQQLYRQIHTIKGTAQTFGLANPASLAHELENVLSVQGKIGETGETNRIILIEGLDFLAASLEKTDFDIPHSFIEKIQEINSNSAAVKGVFLSLIPPEVFDQLTEFEKNKIATALKDNKNLYRLDVVFDIATFSEELRILQDRLREKSEIIITMPNNLDLPEKIGFQIFLSSRENEAALQTDLKDYDAKVVLQTSTTVYSSDLSGVLSQIVAQGKTWAQGLGKEAKISILSDEPDLSTDKLKLIFDILLHLVKNSIDHSIEKQGKVDIRIKEEPGGLQMTISDDGKGVNLEKVRAKAVEKKLITPETMLSEQETLELIFLPGFSTAERVTEISGRGIGLDAVRDMVINTGGTITVESQTGTTFEIFLPVEL